MKPRWMPDWYWSLRRDRVRHVRAGRNADQQVEANDSFSVETAGDGEPMIAMRRTWHTHVTSVDADGFEVCAICGVDRGTDESIAT